MLWVCDCAAQSSAQFTQEILGMGRREINLSGRITTLKSQQMPLGQRAEILAQWKKLGPTHTQTQVPDYYLHQ